MRHDEADGSVDNLFVQPVGRARWLADRPAISATIVFLAGVAPGIASWIRATTQPTHIALGAADLRAMHLWFETQITELLPHNTAGSAHPGA